MLDCINCTLADAFPSEYGDDRYEEETRNAGRMSKKFQLDPEMEDNLDLNTLKERDSLMMQLEQAKREIKMLRAERKSNRLEIEKLKDERQQVQNTLEGKNAENRDVLDSVFDW